MTIIYTPQNEKVKVNIIRSPIVKSNFVIQQDNYWDEINEVDVELV